MPTVEVTVWYLEITGLAQLRPKYVDAPELRIIQAKAPSPGFSRFLYTAVGGDIYWIERLGWTWRQWLDFLDRPELETWVAWLTGTPAGYVELERQSDRSVKIVFFGLLPQFTGRGLGGHLLTFAIERGFALGASHVRVHTCSLDHPAALPNYQARGMRIYRTINAPRSLPDPPPGPWPDAQRPKLF